MIQIILNFLQIIFYGIVIEIMNEINQLKRKAKMGWACYYQAEERHQREILDLLSNLSILQDGLDKIKKTSEEVIPDFITNEIKELYKETKKSIECPICYDIIEVDNLKISNCGHKYCKDCFSKINDCAICRKKIYRKN